MSYYNLQLQEGKTQTALPRGVKHTAAPNQQEGQKVGEQSTGESSQEDFNCSTTTNSSSSGSRKEIEASSSRCEVA